MSTVSSVNSGSNAYGGVSDTAARTPQKVLGQNDFLQLLAVQFQMQDPMKPMEDTAFIAQTAQFTALENSTAMTAELTRLRQEQQRVVANSYLGHTITVGTAEGGLVTGAVSAVENTAEGPQLIVGGEAYPVSSVLRVEPAKVSATAAASVNAAA